MKLLSHILSFFLAVLVMVASMGFTVNKHFCGGELKKVTINQKAEPCPMCKNHEAKPTCHQPAPKHKKGCCENEQDKIQTSDYSPVKTIEQQTITDFQFIAFTYVILTNVYTDDSDSKSSYNEYSPPLIDHDIPVEVQSFLL